MWQHSGTLAAADASLASSGLFTSIAGALDPNGTPLTPQAYASAHRRLGNRAGLPLAEPAALRMPAGIYDAYRARAIGMTGPAVTSAGLILAGTFGVFALAGGGVMGGQMKSIGLGLAVGVLLDTFGVRTLLVPSAVVLLGRWNWWPSRLSRRSPAPGSPCRFRGR